MLLSDSTPDSVTIGFLRSCFKVRRTLEMRRTLSYRLAHNLRHENLEVFVIEDAAKAILRGAIHGDGEAADMGEGDGKTAVFVPLSLSITSAPL